MFENAVYEVADEMFDVKEVHYVNDTHASIYFYSRSRKSCYQCNFRLDDDGETVIIEYVANGPYLSASAPRIFAERVEEKLREY